MSNQWRVKSDGTAATTRIYGPDGRTIEGVESLTINIDAKSNRARLTLHIPHVALELGIIDSEVAAMLLDPSMIKPVAIGKKEDF